MFDKQNFNHYHPVQIRPKQERDVRLCSFFSTLTVRFGGKTLDHVANSRDVFEPNISFEPMRNCATLSNSFLFSGLRPIKSLASKKKRNIVTSY